jgi:hypothetical protein
MAENSVEGSSEVRFGQTAIDGGAGGGVFTWMGGISEWWMLSGGAREMERLREADLWAGESQQVGSELGPMDLARVQTQDQSRKPPRKRNNSEFVSKTETKMK